MTALYFALYIRKSPAGPSLLVERDLVSPTCSLLIPAPVYFPIFQQQSPQVPFTRCLSSVALSSFDTTLSFPINAIDFNLKSLCIEQYSPFCISNGHDCVRYSSTYSSAGDCHDTPLHVISGSWRFSAAKKLFVRARFLGTCISLVRSGSSDRLSTPFPNTSFL